MSLMTVDRACILGLRVNCVQAAAHCRAALHADADAAAAAADAYDEVDDSHHSLMIAVDDADLRREPARYDRHVTTDCGSSVSQLALNAADVAGIITACHSDHQSQRQRHTSQSHDASERVTKSSRDVDAVKVTSLSVSNGRCDAGNDVTDDASCGAAAVQLSQLAAESLSAKETEAFLRQMVWRMSVNQLRRDDWKKLARHWHFTDEHVHAIQCQYTGLYRSICLSVCLSVTL